MTNALLHKLKVIIVMEVLIVGLKFILRGVKLHCQVFTVKVLNTQENLHLGPFC